jgi:preprotein translocase subunit SecA
MAHVPDGIYSVVGSTVALLANVRPSARDLQTLADIIRRARELEQAPEEVEAEIKEKVPELSSLASYFPKTRMEFYALLGVLATVLTVFAAIAVPLLTNNQGLNNEQVEEIVNRSIMKATGEQAAPRGQGKTGRNEPCPCGSGKKYKKCCLNSPGGARR